MLWPKSWYFFLSLFKRQLLLLVKFLELRYVVKTQNAWSVIPFVYTVASKIACPCNLFYLNQKIRVLHRFKFFEINEVVLIWNRLLGLIVIYEFLKVSERRDRVQPTIAYTWSSYFTKYSKFGYIFPAVDFDSCLGIFETFVFC